MSERLFQSLRDKRRPARWLIEQRAATIEALEQQENFEDQADWVDLDAAMYGAEYREVISHRVQYRPSRLITTLGR